MDRAFCCLFRFQTDKKSVTTAPPHNMTKRTYSSTDPRRFLSTRALAIGPSITLEITAKAKRMQAEIDARRAEAQRQR